uniref:Uncharacterized protein n=1 Tax=Solanum tuberosum TaxID=4113 RepID=M1DBT7_SOLTU
MNNDVYHDLKYFKIDCLKGVLIELGLCCRAFSRPLPRPVKGFTFCDALYGLALDLPKSGSSKLVTGKCTTRATTVRSEDHVPLSRLRSSLGFQPSFKSFLLSHWSSFKVGTTVRGEDYGP